MSGWFESAKDFVQRNLGGLHGQIHFGGGAPAGGTVEIGTPQRNNTMLLIVAVIALAFFLGRKA